MVEIVSAAVAVLVLGVSSIGAVAIGVVLAPKKTDQPKDLWTTP